MTYASIQEVWGIPLKDTIHPQHQKMINEQQHVKQPQVPYFMQSHYPNYFPKRIEHFNSVDNQCECRYLKKLLLIFVLIISFLIIFLILLFVIILTK